MNAQLIAPVEADVVVPLPPDEAFALFAAPGEWWPLPQLSIHQNAAATCAIEPFAGGAIFETSTGGERAEWGRVVVWEPPHRLAMTWHPGREASAAMQVEVTFAAEGDGTRVTLRHYGWEVLGDEAEEVRAQYASGWVGVLREDYGKRAAAEAAAR